jgi:hypothetical protein
MGSGARRLARLTYVSIRLKRKMAELYLAIMTNPCFTIVIPY